MLQFNSQSEHYIFSFSLNCSQLPSPNLQIWHFCKSQRLRGRLHVRRACGAGASWFSMKQNVWPVLSRHLGVGQNPREHPTLKGLAIFTWWLRDDDRVEGQQVWTHIHLFTTRPFCACKNMPQNVTISPSTCKGATAFPKMSMEKKMMAGVLAFPMTFAPTGERCLMVR